MSSVSTYLFLTPNSKTLFFGILMADALFAAASAAWLPDQIVARFGASGAADLTLGRIWYVLYGVGLSVALGASFQFGVWWANRSPDLMMLGLPHVDYWLSPAHKEATMRWMIGHLYSFGCATAILLGIEHAVVLVANEHSPALLPVQWDQLVMPAWTATFMVWIVVAFRHFSKR